MFSGCMARPVPALVMLALLLLGLSATPALAAPTVTLFAASVTGPSGGLWLPGPPGTPGHLWVSDALKGFCRVDAGLLTTCDVTARSASQPSYDPTTSNVYVPDASVRGVGVARLHFNPGTESIDAVTVLRPTDGLAASRPQASAVDRLTGSLYLGFKGSANIVRIANPSLGTGDPAVVVAASPDARLTLSLAAVDILGVTELVQANSRGLAVVVNPAGCGACVATALPTSALGLAAPLSLVSDSKSLLYAGDATSVWRLDLSAPLSTSNPGVYASGFSTVSGLALDSLGTVYAGDDPSGGLVPLSGHIWSIASATAPAPAPVLAPITVPGAPTIGTASAGNAQATLTWTAPTSDGGSPITSYTVTAAPGGQTASAVAPATSATVAGLTNGTAYTFTVTAANAIGNGPASAASNSVTPLAPLAVPGAPSAVTATAGDAQASVTWTAPTSDGGSPITSYTVTAAPGGQTASVIPPATGATVSGLTNGTAYTFTVTAANAVGGSPASAPSNAITPGPATLPVSTTGPVVLLTQNPPNPSGSPTATFAFLASPASTSPVTFQCSLAAAGAPNAFAPCSSPQTYSGIANGTYTFTVTATDATGTTGTPVTYTFAVQTLTTPAVVAPSASLLAPATAFLVGVPATISWSATACTTGASGCNIVSYQLQESVNGAPFVDVPLNSPTATSLVRMLRPQLLNQPITTTYAYQVRATNGQGQVSAFAIGPALTLGLLDDSTSTSFSGPWSGNVLLGSLLGLVHWSNTAGAFAGPSNPFLGTGAALVSSVGPERGKALVMLDGVPAALIDLYAPTQRASEVVWSASNLSAARSHTLKVFALGLHNAASSGTRVDYDGLLVLR